MTVLLTRYTVKLLWAITQFLVSKKSLQETTTDATIQVERIQGAGSCVPMYVRLDQVVLEPWGISLLKVFAPFVLYRTGRGPRQN